MAYISQIYDQPSRMTPDYKAESVTIQLFNMDTQEYETHVLSFLELALEICPEGFGKVLVPHPYECGDKDTGPGEDVRFIPEEISEYLQHSFGACTPAGNHIDECIIKKLEQRYIQKHIPVTC